MDSSLTDSSKANADAANDTKLLVGRITSVYGIKGWLKIASYTEPVENLFAYSPCFIQRGNGWQTIEITQWRRHNKVLVAHLRGVEDRDAAKNFTGTDLYTNSEQLPQLESGDYYWKDLIGLTVQSSQGEDFGVVDHLLETGSNDVLVVSASDSSIDDQERLIPYVLDQSVLSIDLKTKKIIVEWDAEF